MAKKRLVKNSRGQYGLLDEATNTVLLIDQSAKLNKDKSGAYSVEKGGLNYDVDEVDDQITSDDLNVLKKKEDTALSSPTASTASGLNPTEESIPPSKRILMVGRLPNHALDYSMLPQKYGAAGEFLADVLDVPTNIINTLSKNILTGMSSDIIASNTSSTTRPSNAKLQEVADYNLKASRLGQSTYTQKLNNKTADTFDTIAALPELIIGSAASQLGAFKSALKGAYGGAISGMGVGFATGGPVGAIAGTATGTIMGATGASTYVNEVGGAIMQKLAEKGVDITDGDELIKAFKDKETINAAREYGMKRGIPIALIDMATAGLSQLTGKAAIKIASSFAKNAGKELTEKAIKNLAGSAAFATEVIGGSLGEAAGQKIAEGKISDTDAILLEGIAELGPGVPSAIYSYVKANQVNAKLNESTDDEVYRLSSVLHGLDENDPNRQILQGKIDTLQSEKERRNSFTATSLEAAPVTVSKRILDITDQIESLQGSLDALKAGTHGEDLSEEQIAERRRVFNDQMNDLMSERDELLAEADKAKESLAVTLDTPTAPMPIEKQAGGFNIIDTDNEIEQNEDFKIDVDQPLEVTQSETKNVAVEQTTEGGEPKRTQAGVLNIEQGGKKVATALEVTQDDGTTKFVVPELNQTFNTIAEAQAAVKDKLSGQRLTEPQKSGINRVLVRKGIGRTPIVFTKNGEQMELSMEEKTKAIRAAQALRTVSDANIYLYSNDDDYVAGLRGESSQEGFDEQGARRSNASYVKGGNIHINLSKMNTHTLSHEIFHATLVSIAKKNPSAFIEMQDKIMKKINPNATLRIMDRKTGQISEITGQEYLDRFSEKYKGEGKEIQAQEYLSELAGLLSNNEQILTDKSFMDNVKLSIRGLLKKLNIDTTLFDEIADTAELVDFMKSFNESLKTGGRINLDKISQKYEGRRKKVSAEGGQETTTTAVSGGGNETPTEGQSNIEPIQGAVKRKRGNKTPTAQRKIKDPTLLKALSIETNSMVDMAKQFFIGGGKIIRGRTQDISKRTVEPQAGSLITLFTKKFGFGYKDDTKAMKARFHLTATEEKGGLLMSEIAEEIMSSPNGKKYKVTKADAMEALRQVLLEFSDKKEMAKSVLESEQALAQAEREQIDTEVESEQKTQEELDGIKAEAAGMDIEAYQEAVGQDEGVDEIETAMEEAIDIAENPEEYPEIEGMTDVTQEEQEIIDGMTEEESKEYLEGTDIEPLPVKRGRKKKADLTKGAGEKTKASKGKVAYDEDLDKNSVKGLRNDQVLPRLDLESMVKEGLISKEDADNINFIWTELQDHKTTGEYANFDIPTLLIARKNIKSILSKKGELTGAVSPKFYERHMKLLKALGNGVHLNKPLKFGIFENQDGIFNVKFWNGKSLNSDVKYDNKGFEYDTYEEAVARVRELINAPKSSVGFEINKTFTGTYAIVKKFKGLTFDVLLDSGTDFKWFKTRQAAELYIQENREFLEKAWNSDNMKTYIEKELKKFESERNGPDWRAGQNITSEQITNTFGFKGIEFNTGMTKAERQDLLNKAYESLMDLASVIGLPTNTIGLNKEMHLTFGTRKSTKNAQAHYERGKFILSMNRNTSQGSLAHEWFHALDNYFSSISGKEFADLKLMTDDTSSSQGRKKMANAFEAFGKYFDKKNKSSYKSRTQANGGDWGVYASTNRELAARAFEVYIQEKLAEDGYKNTYLVELYNSIAPDQNNYFYPIESEFKDLFPLFDNLFNSMNVFEAEDKGILYQTDEIGPADNPNEYKMVQLYGRPEEMLAHFNAKADIGYAAGQKGLAKGLRTTSRNIEKAISNNIVTRVVSKAFNVGMNAIQYVGDAGFVTYTSIDEDGKQQTKKVSINSIVQGAFGTTENGLRKRVIEGIESTNKFADIAASTVSSLVKNLAVTEKMQKTSREFIGYKNNAHNLIFRLSKSLNGMVSFDAQALRRVHSLIDPEAYTGVEDDSLPTNPLDLSVPELRLYNFLRSMNDYIHEWHMQNGFLDQETYDKFKGKYFARFYTEIEKKKYSDLSKAFEQSTAGADLNMFKQRKDFEMVELDLLEDPIYATCRRLATMAHNQAVIEFCDTVYEDGEYKIYNTDDGIPANQKSAYKKLDGFGNPRRFGELTNKYVPLVIYEQLYGTTFANEYIQKTFRAFKWYDKLWLRQILKKSKTVYNPLARLGNIVSSFAFAFQGGVDPITLLKNRPEAKEAIDSYNEYVQELTLAGVLGTNGINEMLGSFSDESWQYKALKSLKVPEKALASANEFDKMVKDSYGKADDVAKVAMYISLVKDRGIPKDQAVQIVAESMQNYNTVGKAFVLSSMMPVFGNAFIRFKADATRILYNGLSKRPLYTLAYMGLLYGAKELLSDWSGEDEDEKKARESRPFTTKFGAGPFEISMNWKVGNKEINAARYLSPYYVYDQGYYGDNLVDITQYLPNQIQKLQPGRKGILGTPYVPALNDPLLGPAAQVFFDYDFKGIAIADPRANAFVTQTVSDKQQVRNQLSFLGRSLGNPYYGWIADIDAAANGKLDAYDRKRSPMEAALNLVIKNEEIDSEILQKKYISHLHRMEAEAKAAITIMNAEHKKVEEFKIKQRSRTDIPKEQIEELINERLEQKEELRLEKINDFNRIKKEYKEPFELFMKLRTPKDPKKQ